MRRLFTTLALAAAAFAVSATAAAAATYYVSPTGNDSNSGTSQSAPWRTVTRVDNASLAPGATVLFQGGATFSDNTLMPTASGTASAPITFGSYGSGRATISNANGAVWFSGKNYLTFTNLALNSRGSQNAVFTSSASAPSAYIALRNSLVNGTAGNGVRSSSTGDHDWTLSGDTITGTGDSGVLIFGSGFTVDSSTISHTGLNSSLSYAKHGIYAKGPNVTISNDDFFDNETGQAISLRFHGARIFGNQIHDTPYAIAFFDDDPAAAPQGTDYVYSNRLWNISGYAFYYDGQSSPLGQAPSVSFVLASNTIGLTSGAEAINVSPSGSAHVTIANNIVSGSYGSALRPASTTSETHNLWYGAGSNVPHGSGDLYVAPQDGTAPTFALASTSPAIDTGTASGAGMTYSPTCSGAPLSYCGNAPDLGASEAAAAAPVAPPAAPSDLAAVAVGPSTLTLTWKASTTSGVSYRLTQNSSALATTSATSYAVGRLACASTYTFSVAAASSAGAVSPAVAIQVQTLPCPDTTPPTVKIGSPAANASVGLSFAVSASASDASGIGMVAYMLDGVLRCSSSSASGSCAMTTTAGWHMVTVLAVDRAGNVASALARVYAK